jgi:hypothetical protein
MCLFCVCVVLCLGRGLAMSWTLIQGVLLPVKWSWNWKKSEARAQGGCRASEKKIVSIYLAFYTIAVAHKKTTVSSGLCSYTYMISFLSFALKSLLIIMSGWFTRRFSNHFVCNFSLSDCYVCQNPALPVSSWSDLVLIFIFVSGLSVFQNLVASFKVGDELIRNNVYVWILISSSWQCF